MEGKNHYAIKPFHPPLAPGDEVPLALVAEVRLLAGLEHPNVVRPVTIGESSDGHHLVMEYVEGTSLERVRQEAWRQGVEIPLRLTVRVVLDALAGLAAVHELCDERGRPLGMVHRDMSPRSVLVGADGVARIANLGVERRMGYMDAVRRQHIDRRAELFAIGVMLWEGAANRRLFAPAAGGGEAIECVVQHTVPRLDQVSKSVPRGIAAVCARALDPDVTWRYPSAAALAEALEGAALDADALGDRAEVAGFVERLVAGPVTETEAGAARRRAFAAGTDIAPAEPRGQRPPPPPMSPPHPPADPGRPERFGKYSVIRHLADGGMAEVYLARASGIEGFEKNVVIKRLKPELAENPWATELFLQEARIAATLEHPQIAQVHDAGAVDGSYFLAMEYVHGQDLRMLIRRARRRGGDFPLEVAIRIVAELCGALHHAHEKCDADGVPLGLVHRDVSPSNVLVSYDGAVKLCDFGIAEVTAQSDPRKRTRAGKLSYMSPEQCRGDLLDRRSDIFVLAIVLYELTTMSKLFKGASEREVMRQVVEGRVRPPSEVRPGYPPELERIVMKGLAVDPSGRHATALEMMLELEALGREHKLALSSVGLAQLMEELFAPHERGAVLPIGVESITDLEYAEIVEIRPPRPWYRAWLLGLALAAGVAAAAIASVASRSAALAARVADARAAAGRIGERLSFQVRAARERAAAIAASPMLRAAVATDARTVQDMVAHEDLLAPRPGEVIELVQRRGSRATSLARLPAGAGPTAPVEAGAMRIDPAQGGVVVTAAARVAAVYGDTAVDGALVVASRLERATLAGELPPGLQRASIRGLEREVELIAPRRPPSGGRGAELAVPLAREWMPEVTLNVELPPLAGDGLRAARWIACALAFACLAFYLVGRHRHRFWRRRW